MAANMAELLALLRGPNRASSSSTPLPRQGPTVDPAPWVPPTQAPENMDAPAPPTLRTSMAHPFTSPFPPPPAPTAIPLPPTAFLTSDQALSAPPPVPIPAPAAAYTVPPPMVFPASTPLPISTTFHELGTPTHAAQFASPTHFFLEADAEQERRLKRMEETIRALQANDARPNARYGDCSLFPGMRLPPKFKIPEFKTYGGTTDPRHHLRHYRGKMLQYWESASHPPGAEHKRDGAGPKLLAGDQIRPISPGPNFDPSIQDQFKRCKYHQGAPGHTLDNCWRLRDEIQRRIDSNRLTFNAVRPPNVQDNPLPDHRLSSRPSINMISACASGKDEDTRDDPLPFVIYYTPEEPTVGFAGHVASSAPFVVDIPAREPYTDSKVPWTYEGRLRTSRAHAARPACLPARTSSRPARPHTPAARPARPRASRALQPHAPCT
ncbi:hypothetical protein CRG98_004834 [Punica granatum]|uniref:Uncharacterized protein n=1 Tax=Punica granatum TaxID=22663 RepID=A0A2I0L3V6_PUNGR|nr:hypothetical protein CRG98_004834 [Punica granatum]